MMSEKEILDLPTGVVSFYMDTVDPRTPGILHYFGFVISAYALFSCS